MEQVTITGLDRVRSPRQTAQGHTILAHFSADVGVFTIKGLALVRTNRGGIAAWLPKLEDGRGAKLKSITLNDEPTRNAILQAARDMYIRMGGTGAEYGESDDDLHPYRGSDADGWPTHPLHPNYEPPEDAQADDTLPAEILPPPIGRTAIPVTVRRTGTAG